MVWKSIYYFYIFLTICLIIGIVLAIVFGLNNNNNNNKSTETSVSQPSVTKPSANETTKNVSIDDSPRRITESNESVKADKSVKSQKLVESEKVGQQSEIPTTPIITVSQVSQVSTVSTVSPDITSNSESVPTPPIPVESLKIDPIELKFQSSVTIPRNISPSFGLAVSHIDRFVFIGAPMDETYGKVWIYEYKDSNSQFILRHTLKFHLVGSIYQQAGFGIQQNIVAAPNFTLKSDPLKVPEGTLFLIDHYNTSDPEIHRLTTDLKDNYYMVKHGQIFAFTPPYVWVTKTQESTQCVDIYQLDTSSQSLQFLQRLTVPEPDNMFGHNITQMSEKHTIFIGDPVTNNYYGYIKNNTKNDAKNDTKNNIGFALQTRININNLLPNEDLNQMCALQPQGDFFVIASPANHLILIYRLTYQWNLWQSISIDTDMTITGLEFISDSTLSILFASKTIYFYRQDPITQQFQLFTTQSLAINFPFTEINSNLVWITPKTMVTCSIAELEHDGQLSVYHT